MTAAADLPIIDFSVLSQRDSKGHRTSDSLATRHELFFALRNTGFMYLRHPGSSQAKVDKLFRHSRTFFAKPLDTKKSILGRMDLGRGPSQGYSNPALLAADPTTSDIKEFFGLYRDDDQLRPNQWLSDAESVAMRSDLVSFFETCHEVILELLGALAEEIGLATNALHASIEEKNHFIACLHYPPAPKSAFKERVRAAAHTDYGCLTLLFNDGGQGLQVMKQNGEYEYVARMDDCAIVNGEPLWSRISFHQLTVSVGDLLSRFFNGILPSTMHRVIEPPTAAGESDKDVPARYSIAFFAHFNADLLVKPLSAVVSEAQPVKFEPVVAGEHVKSRVRQLHIAGHSLKANAEALNSAAPVTVVAS